MTHSGTEKVTTFQFSLATSCVTCHVLCYNNPTGLV